MASDDGPGDGAGSPAAKRTRRVRKAKRPAKGAEQISVEEVPIPPWEVATGSGTGGSYAYRPGRLLVRRSDWERADDAGRQRLKGILGVTDDSRRLPTVVVLEGVADVEAGLALIRAEGMVARPDIVFFAVPADGSVSSAPVTFGGVAGAPVTFGGVGGAPVTFGSVAGAPVTFGSVAGAPVTFGSVAGAPVTFGGVGGAPVTFGGVLVVPVTFGGVGGGGGACCHRCAGGGEHRCGCGCEPAAPSPIPAPRRSTVRKASAPVDPLPDAQPGGTPCRVVIIDTGFVHDTFRPADFDVDAKRGTPDVPDANQDDALDVASGHGTFIAGVVRRLAPGAVVEVRQVMTTFGDASDSQVATALEDVLVEVRAGDGPQIVNLSFAGYSDDDTAPPAAAAALAELRARGVVVVAAAGNDATCRPAWPAATSGVIGVGAIDDDGPAWFTNHGPWVQACAPGVDVLSRFFTYPQGTKPTGDAEHPVQPDGNGWAKWSGTSFAAPIVAGVLARRVTEGIDAQDAVKVVVEDPNLFRLPWLGTVVNVRPW